MITLKLSIRPSEIMPLAKCISTILEDTKMNVQDFFYTDYYNTRHFIKMLVDKSYLLFNKNTNKPVKFNVNINVFDSILYMYNINSKYLNLPEQTHVQAIFYNVIDQMLKQQPNIKMMS